MVNRRLGKSVRNVQKKKLKISKRLLASGGRSEPVHDDDEEHRPAVGNKKRNSKKAPAASSKDKKNLSLPKQRSETLKRQATERMVLKEHLRELKERRLRTRKGPDAKTERRELGKYIKQLETEQKQNHSKELGDIEHQIKVGKKKAALAGFEGAAGRDEVSEQELKDMFSHLVA
ncbi:Hypothetical protein, putative [Bodo saltans]|uniref:Uncharacterized protein n=1 Tax=Bodo saltans TaxID=75058 RepID=A0A0S4JFM3_BODSA|nr:Hypothetical protein, putative [Bodo saltans]|eukprot:CUG88788.1 Hypothetical protein, putative [Bodo saltans]